MTLPQHKKHQDLIYRKPYGRFAPRSELQDNCEPSAALINLRTVAVTAEEFIHRIERELRIRFYQRQSIGTYVMALRGLFGFLGISPNDVTREHVREYLEMLVDGGASASAVSTHLSAIRTSFDKLCAESITLGLAMPRKRKRLPIVLSESEIVRLLRSAPSIRDKLVLGTMYATGMRVSEVVRLRWQHIDFEREQILVSQGKGRKDRMVMLPKSFVPLFDRVAARRRNGNCDENYNGNYNGKKDWVFAAREPDRHICPRTVQRVMARALRMAGIQKRATPHTLRHAFATHLLENGTDIRFIQRLLGHMRLETTTLYTRVARPRLGRVESPADRILLGNAKDLADGPIHAPPVEVGRMRLVVEPIDSKSASATMVVLRSVGPVEFNGMVIRMSRPGWYALDFPPLEDWQSRLALLTPSQRMRMEKPEFYEQLQRELGNLFKKQLAELSR